MRTGYAWQKAISQKFALHAELSSNRNTSVPAIGHHTDKEAEASPPVATRMRMPQNVRAYKHIRRDGVELYSAIDNEKLHRLDERECIFLNDPRHHPKEALQRESLSTDDMSNNIPSI